MTNSHGPEFLSGMLCLSSVLSKETLEFFSVLDWKIWQEALFWHALMVAASGDVNSKARCSHVELAEAYSILEGFCIAKEAGLAPIIAELD
ncbi:hypothetical protein TorRG33x02_029540 [Trema orientale]|uniref:Uncharacterized protein n=1 Tax=Trema orientale TaxID=63057 RepID=A0A2P5FTV2_TREOI|nr:hypothetical protein TorRG33x02_029540 [Trema orientale]